MNPKEKANEIVNKYLIGTPIGFHIKEAKLCALIAVGEIINSGKDVDQFADSYWYEVKKEIEKL